MDRGNCKSCHYLPIRKLFPRPSVIFPLLALVMIIAIHRLYFNNTELKDSAVAVAHVAQSKSSEEESYLKLQWDEKRDLALLVPITKHKGRENNNHSSADTNGINECRVDIQNLKQEKQPEKGLMKEWRLAYKFMRFLKKGGGYSPPRCQARQNMALVIPFRNRHAHLPILLNTLLPMMIAQKLRFSIFVVEQIEPTPFNKGTVYNAAVKEILAIDPSIECFVLHDVDMMPISERNFYHCDREFPVHFMAGLDKWKYGLLYQNLTGGVIAFTREQYERLNGFSNLFFGWGCEDDDMTHRIRVQYGAFYRKNLDVGRYDMLEHSPDMGFEATHTRLKLVELTRSTMDQDGLSNVVYRRVRMHKTRLYTWISIDVRMENVIQKAPESIVPFFKTSISEYRHLYGTYRVNWERVERTLSERLSNISRTQESLASEVLTI